MQLSLIVLLSESTIAVATFDSVGKTSNVLLSPGTSQGINSGYQLDQFPLPKGSSAPFAIANDPSGVIWVAEQGSNQIGSFDPITHLFKEYSIPTPNSDVSSISVDNKSNVWFTELNSNNLGELRDGAVKEFRVPGAILSVGGKSQEQSCGPTAALPDRFDHIWVICIFSNQIDEFFPSNESFSIFNLPVFQSGPAGLVFDHNGDFWFTAADAAMIGHGVVSQLVNGTSDGITEFPPLNDSYIFNFQESTSFLGNTKNVESSLPTPTGIALSPDGGTLWISEHVDSSFDSFNIQSKSFDRFWTSKTNNVFGYPVSLPNGIVVDPQGIVWVAEHYGNKIAEFNPTNHEMVEYNVPCCGPTSAGIYTLTLGKNGTVWFVEIFGNAIGELSPDPLPASLTIKPEETILQLNSSASVDVPIMIAQTAASNYSSEVKLDLSGLSSTGNLSAVQANFFPNSLQLAGSQNATSTLRMAIGASLKPGVYYLTVSATMSDGTVYSTILQLEILSSTNQLFVYAAVIGGVASILVVLTLAFRMRRTRKHGYPRPRSKFRTRYQERHLRT
jgi:virginiamycin B lyase